MDYGVPLGHRFRALKLWFVLRYYGHEGLARILRDQIAMTHELRDRLAADPRFEICAPTLLSLICFRRKGNDDENRALLDAVTRDGRFFLSSTVAQGRYMLRMAIGNIFTGRKDLEELWTLLSELAGI
jgi:aromatic-L-amino-acid/L-tryptophan decarboxylase